MIHTITFDPALDYVVEVNRFTLGMINRTVQEDACCGDRGINASMMLKNLGYDNTTLGFVAGFAGGETVRGVKVLGFAPDLVRVEHGISRINVKMRPDEESEISGMGPGITPEGAEKLFEKLEKLTDDDILILLGNIPKSIDDDIYESVMAGLDGRGIRIVVGAEKDLLLNVFQYHPSPIKPNNHELGSIFGVVLNGDGEIAEYAKKLQERDARNMLISMAGDRAILVNETGKTHRMRVSKGAVRSPVGAGGSMAAGFMAGYLEWQGYKHTLRPGNAVGGASAFPGGLASKEDIMKLY